MTKFAGYITAIDRDQDEESNAEDVIVECTDLTEDGEVEIAFDDRNERCYVKFKLQDLITAACQAGVPSKSV